MTHQGTNRPDWPDVFSNFPSDDNNAALAWFLEPGNLDFTSWDNCIGEKAEHWKGLELSLQTISSQPIAEVRRCGKDAVGEVFGDARLKKHITRAQKDEIGEIACRNLSEEVQYGWKSASMPWVQLACRALSPRFTHLWKKTERAHKTKTTQGESKARSEPPQPSENSELSKHGRAKGESLSKKRKLPHRISETIAPGSSSPTPSRTKLARPASSSRIPILQEPERYSYLLCDRDLEVRMDLVPGEMELDKIDHVTIAITAIVHDHVLVYESNNIRPEHLSFEKFCKILKLTDLNFDFRENEKALTWEVMLTARQMQQKEIKEEGDFQTAIGVLAWAATRGGLERVLVMRIRPCGEE